MNRLLLFICGFITCICGTAQITPDDIFFDGLSNEVSFIFDYDSPAKAKYFNAKMWAAKQYKNFKEVCMLDDDVNYKFVFKGVQPLEIGPNTYDSSNKSFNTQAITTESDFTLEYTLTVSCKDAKYRIKFENLAQKSLISIKNHGGMAGNLAHSFNASIPLKDTRNYIESDIINEIDSLKQLLPSAKKDGKRSLLFNIENLEIALKNLPVTKVRLKRVKEIISLIVNDLKDAIEKGDEDDF